MKRTTIVTRGNQRDCSNVFFNLWIQVTRSPEVWQECNRFPWNSSGQERIYVGFPEGGRDSNFLQEHHFSGTWKLTVEKRSPRKNEFDKLKLDLFLYSYSCVVLLSERKQRQRESMGGWVGSRTRLGIPLL